MSAMMTQNDIRNTPGACFAYYGERGDWPIVMTIHRDSDMIERSNWDVALKRLDPAGDNENVQIERASHWAVGWIELLLIAPGDQELAAKAREIQDAIEQYPILDESAYSDMVAESHAHGECDAHCDWCEEERELDRSHVDGECTQWCDEYCQVRTHLQLPDDDHTYSCPPFCHVAELRD